MGSSTRDLPADPADHRHRLAEIILGESRRAGLGSGAKLPTERKLAADLGATRTSVRRALAVLEAEGRISREVGRGTFLRDGPSPPAGTSGNGIADGASRAGGPGALPEPAAGRDSALGHSDL